MRNAIAFFTSNQSSYVTGQCLIVNGGRCSLVSLGYREFNRNKHTYYPISGLGLLGRWIDPSFFQGGAIIRLVHDINQVASDRVVLALGRCLACMVAWRTAS